jgi:hypothetical protein
MLCLPPSLEGQLRVRVGGGALVEEHAKFPPEAAFHAMVDATADLNSVMGLRLGGFVGTGTRLASRDLALGTQLEMLVQWPAGSSVRPYLGLGLSYTKTDDSPFEPVSYDFGINLPIGVESQRGWFLEINPRFFGNMFYQNAVTQWLTLVSVGWRIH